MESYPNLSGVAVEGLVETIGTGKYSARYINWSRTLEMLRTHAPGWLPETVPTESGSLVHPAPVGGYMLLRFRHYDGRTTPAVPQAVMDNRNNSIPMDKITARDITDTQRRGTCMAAAFTFGLAYELWAKLPLETGFAGESNKTISDAQAAEIDGLCQRIDDDMATYRKMIAAYKVDRVEGLAASAFVAIKKKLECKLAQGEVPG